MQLSAVELDAIRLTLIVSTVAVVASLPVAVGLAWLFAKKQFYGKTVLDVIVNLPLVMPPVVTGYLLLVIFGRSGPVGSLLHEYFGIQMIFNWKGAALASAIVGFPLLLRPIRVAFEGVDDRLLQAARTLGASPLNAFWTIAFPLSRSGVLAGCILAFARSMGEFGATIMIAGNIPGETQTISLMVYSLLDSPNGFVLSIKLIVVSIVISSLALFVSANLERLQRQRVKGAGI